MINERNTPMMLGDRDGYGPLETWFLAELDGQADNEQPSR